MGRLSPQIVKLVEAEKPDIMTTQEVFDVSGEVIWPDRMFDVLDRMKQAGGFPYVYFSPVASFGVAHQQATMGNAVLSKVPFASQDSFFVNGTYNPDLKPETQVGNSRNAQVVRIEVGDKALHIINHHAFWDKSPLGNETSVEKMQLVKDRAAEIDGALIVAGDLNVTAASPAMRVFDNFLTDLTATHNVTATLSVLGKAKDVACDHILVNDQITVNEFRVIDELVSDHKALLLDFDVA